MDSPQGASSFARDISNPYVTNTREIPGQLVWCYPWALSVLSRTALDMAGQEERRQREYQDWEFNTAITVYFGGFLQRGVC